MRLLLASGSPRRRALLESLGLAFEAVTPDVDERRFPDEDPDRYVERVARAKAEKVAGPDHVTLAADTTVVHQGHVLGKPSHPAEARSMLRRLAGEAHTVHTGVAVAGVDGDATRVVSLVERSVVWLTELTDGEIASYVAGGEPMDKAGAYALQGFGGVFVDRIEGSASNVVGLPLHVLPRLFAAFGLDLFTMAAADRSDDRREPGFVVPPG